MPKVTFIEASGGSHEVDLSNGISNNGMWPNLAGQKAPYLVSQLKQFRDGKRDNAMMTAMAQGLTDEDIANLAAYYASLK